MGRPSVCFVAPNLYPILVGDGSKGFAGGAEVQQNFIARGLVARGYSVSIVTSDFGQDDDFRVDGIRVIKIATRHSRLPFIRFIHPGITSLWSALKSSDADIYYQRSAGWPTGIVGMYCRFHQRQFIYAAAHDLDLIKERTHVLFNYPQAWRAKLLFRFGLRSANAIVAQTAVQHDACRQWHMRDAVQIPSGYSPLRSSNCIKQPSLNVLWVAALRKWKRPELFLELARCLPTIHFHMVGGAEPGEEGKALYLKTKLLAGNLPNVTFHGFLPLVEADSLFEKATLFINTSDSEGFPNTFLQAWSRGVPTISFVNCGAHDDAGSIGVVVRSFNEMVEAVQRLAIDDTARKAEGSRARLYFDQYHSVDAVIDKYELLFTSLLARSKTWR